MITIEYSPEGIAIADAKADDFVKRLILTQELIDIDDSYIGTKPNIEEHISTSNVIDSARCAVLDGANIRFKFEGKILEIDKNGMLAVPYPKGFSDYYMRNWCPKLLKGSKK